MPSFQTKTGLDRFFLLGRHCANSQTMIFLGPDGLSQSRIWPSSLDCSVTQHSYIFSPFSPSKLFRKGLMLNHFKGVDYGRKSNWKIKVLFSAINSMPCNPSFQQGSRQTFGEKSRQPFHLFSLRSHEAERMNSWKKWGTETRWVGKEGSNKEMGRRGSL